ncbi:solute carrier family 40 member 1-like isoform X1 [Biomphalaria glabrata]|uniref:Solute carrier family 40 member n=1 Tax=Biomphalaria glabrata TaxID=6526 RepID=A0A2C9K739_BIOGL|nr:solute carrier family 40 member 1-like isoform X1 [Biomphalaria glabrata]XP_055881723.1 solute carrier family 40 member 1-like isoform X1 [Biomphalaria glabrata]KAI8755575.1 solute carrier family 40 member 1-like isoform X3 [Biomphalaria glabrata]
MASMSACCKKWNGNNFFVYFSHFLSAWGDRMWAFGVGLFLINISSESLQLTAAYGLSMSLSVLLFGALVGDIVDETPRLKAAQTALVLQNLFVIICAVLIFFFLTYMSAIVSFGQWTRYTVYVLIILLCVLSRLTSMARQIAVEKDWIVEMCGEDKDRLATMTAALRRIDLSTQILAPMATGFIMALAGVEFGAIFIGAWNFGSVFIEYYFLWKVYNTVPALMKKKNLKKSQVATELKENLVKEKDAFDQGRPLEECMTLQDKDNLDTTDDEKKEENEALNNQEISVTPETEKKVKKKCTFTRLFNSLERLYLGWPVYVSYDIRNAGLALACLYMTVLGFDSVTVGYAKTQGVSELLVGIMMALAASFGIFGTFMYPYMRRRLGLARTGIFGLSLQITCLVLCVVSVWMPGSKFDLFLDTNLNATNAMELSCIENSTLDVNSTIPCSKETLSLSENVSIWMLLAGIITARFGLWVADLTVSQLFMESVAEKERGKVNGVQSSLNQLMDMLKYLMVVLAPHEHQFGLLVHISFGFICIGWLFYAFFLRKSRGHFFHFEKCIQKNNLHTNS